MSLVVRNQPAQLIRRKIHGVYDLMCRKKIRAAETELAKLQKKHKNMVSVKALALWMAVIQHNSPDTIMDLCSFLNELRLAEEDDQAPLILASAFRSLHRVDLAAATFGIYAERFGQAMYYEQYFEYLLRSGNCDDLNKVAMRLHQMDSSILNKYRVCVSAFVQAAMRDTAKEREMGFKFASMLATRVFKDESDQTYLENYLSWIKERRPTERFNYPDMSTYPVLDASSALDQTPIRPVPSICDFAHEKCLLTTEDRKKEHAALLEKLKAKNNDWGDWERAIRNVMLIDSAEANDAAAKELAGVFKTLKLESDLLDQDALLALISAMRLMVLDGFDDIGDLVVEYVSRFGYRAETASLIATFFIFLDSNDQLRVIKANDIGFRAARLILSPWWKQARDCRGIDFVRPSAEEYEKHVSTIKLLDDVVPRNFDQAVVLFYQRQLFGEILENAKSLGTRKEDVYSCVDRWDDAIDFLFNLKMPALNAESVITGIIRQCSDYFFSLYSRDPSPRYLETLVCFLHKQQMKYDSPNQVLQILFLNCYLLLGYVQPAQKILKEMSIRPLQILSIGYLCDYSIEAVGRFDEAQKFYESMSVMYEDLVTDMEDSLVYAYREGRAVQALEIFSAMVEDRNTIQRAVQYSRRRFLDIILNSKTAKDLKDLLISDSWPTEHPFDHRDYQLVLQSQAVQMPSVSAFVKSKSYCTQISEISTLKLLLDLLGFIVYESKGNDTASKLTTMKNHIIREYNYILSAEERGENIDGVVTVVSNSLNNKVVGYFIDLIKAFIDCVVLILNYKQPENISEYLLMPRLFCSRFDHISATIANVFKKKHNYGHRLEVLAATTKMIHYLAQLLLAIYSMISDLLKTSFEQMKLQRKTRPIYDRFRRYCAELRIMFNYIDGLIVKFSKRIDKMEAAFKQPADSTPTALAVHQLYADRHADLKVSLASLRRYQNLECLVRAGLLDE